MKSYKTFTILFAIAIIFFSFKDKYKGSNNSPELVFHSELDTIFMDQYILGRKYVHPNYKLYVFDKYRSDLSFENSDRDTSLWKSFSMSTLNKYSKEVKKDNNLMVPANHLGCELVSNDSPRSKEKNVGYILFSKPVFNKNGKTALMQVDITWDNISGFAGGSGWTFLFTKENNRWYSYSQFMRWIK